MASARLGVVVPLLAVEMGLAVTATVFYFALTAEYGDVNASALQSFTAGFGYGFATVGLVLVGATALLVIVLSSQRWVQLTALAIPVLMLIGMLAVIPAALGRKLESQFESTPRCFWAEEGGVGPGMEAAVNPSEFPIRSSTSATSAVAAAWVSVVATLFS